MKKILLLLLIPVLSSCTYQYKLEDYNYLPDNSLRLIRSYNNTSILINKNNKYYLLLLDKPNINIKVDYLIKLYNTNYNIITKEEYYLDNILSINDIEFKKNDKIEILLDNIKFCIYIKELDKDNYSTCDYIYLYNIDKDFYITLNNSLLVLFYHSYTKFNYKFMYHLSTVWIDTYTLDNNSYTTLTIKRDKDFTITSNKLLENTIHKK